MRAYELYEGPWEDVFSAIKGIFSKKIDNDDPSLPSWLEAIVAVTDEFRYINFNISPSGETNISSKNTDLKSSKTALHELALLKKSIQIEKKQFQIELRDVRQTQADRVANQHALLPGMGKFGMAYRYAARASRASVRSQVSAITQEYNAVLRNCDLLLRAIAQLELAIEKEILTGNYKPVQKPVDTNPSSHTATTPKIKNSDGTSSEINQLKKLAGITTKPQAPKAEPVKQQPKPQAPKAEPVKQQPKPQSTGRFAYNPLGR